MSIEEEEHKAEIINPGHIVNLVEKPEEEEIKYRLDIWYIDGGSETIEQRESDLSFAKFEDGFFQFRSEKKTKSWINCSVIERVDLYIYPEDA